MLTTRTAAILAILLACLTAQAQPAALKPQPVSIHVTTPAPLASDAPAIAIKVDFQNTSERDATIVWEKARSIRVFRSHILVGTAGWGSDPTGWITLKAGEKTTRTVTLQAGEDTPALDPGNYALELDFEFYEADKVDDATHLQLEVPLKVTGGAPAHSLAAAVKAAADFYQARKLYPGEERVAVDTWELTPWSITPPLWQITFCENRPGGARTARVCVSKKDGKAQEPPFDIIVAPAPKKQ